MEIEVIILVFDTFIAANTYKGFFSYFDELLYGEDHSRVYLIKGGPGCGKSTFMKKVAKAAEKKGFDVERIYCSSDPDSLDGVKIKDTDTVIIDATAPHAYDMKYPGAYESIIDLSKFWNESALEKNKREIKALFEEISERYRGVYCILKTAGLIQSRRCALTEPKADTEKITAAIKKIIKQNAIVSIENQPKTENRMLSAFSGSGIVTLSETTEKICDEYIVFEDSAGIAHLFLAKLAVVMTKMGYDSIRVHSPLCPDAKLEQILLPQLRLGFIASGHLYSPSIDEKKVIKKINTKAFTDREFYSQNRNKLSFLKKTERELISSVCDELKVIKQKHDELETYYISAADHSALNRFTEQFTANV